MDIELIDKAWACLPKEFKEGVKKDYKICSEGCRVVSAGAEKLELRGCYRELEELFGHHNLTSDEEGEEILYVKASQAKELYQYAEEREKGRAPRESEEEWYQGYMKAMQDLFGSKCLPDANEDNFVSIEPQPAEPKNEGTSQEQHVPKNVESGTHSFNHILKDDFRDHHRLHIAAMIAQGIMTNSNPQMVDMKVERMVDLAILTADALIKKVEGDSK